jgi:hypothetical protein
VGGAVEVWGARMDVLFLVVQNSGQVHGDTEFLFMLAVELTLHKQS